MAPRAGLHRNAGLGERGPASAPCLIEAAARPWARARAVLDPPRHTRTPASSRKNSLTLARAANERSGGAADRPTPKSAAGRRLAAHHRGSADRPTPHKSRSNAAHTRPERATRPRQRPSPAAPPPAAVAQDLPHEADAREEDGPEPAHPPVDPHAHGQQDPLELEAAALAPHQARPLVELPKKRVRLSL